MGIKNFFKALTVLLAGGLMVNSNANSVGFNTTEYSGLNPTISVRLVYDFTDFAMFGGSVDVFFDPSALEFVSYTQADLPSDAEADASPVGALSAGNTYSNVGIGTFNVTNGMTSAGTIGTFVFNVFGGGPTGATPCGETLCVQVNAINPFVSLTGENVSAELLGNGISEAIISIYPFPIPAAVWFMLSGLGALYAFGRKS